MFFIILISIICITALFRPADPQPHLLDLPGPWLGHAAGAADGGVSGGGAGLQGVQPAGVHHPATTTSYRWESTLDRIDANFVC